MMEIKGEVQHGSWCVWDFCVSVRVFSSQIITWPEKQGIWLDIWISNTSNLIEDSSSLA